MTVETSNSSGHILNEKSSYIQKLRQSGFTMTEVKTPANRFNAVIYQHGNGVENLPHGEKNNLMMLYGTLGEAGSTTHISTLFLSELKDKVNTVIGYNSALSFSSVEAEKYDHDLNMHANQIIELYEQGIPQEKRGQPITIVGHSMGGATAPIVAKRLLERGFNVSKIVLIAPPGLADRSDSKMLRDFLKLLERKRIYADIPVLYPSPADTAAFRKRFEELSQKTELTRQEIEEMATYQLSIKRQIEPDKLTLSNMSRRKISKIKKIDDEIAHLLDSTDSGAQTRIDKLQRRRQKLLLKPIRKVAAGKINNERTQERSKTKQNLRRTGNLIKSTHEITKTVSDMASESTLISIQEVIDYHDDSDNKRPLDITVISGRTDPIVGSYKVGDVREKTEEKNVTITEIGMTNFDHFSLPDDPVRVAQVIGRIMDNEMFVQH